MTESDFISQKKKFQKSKECFTKRYCHCNWCGKDLNIEKDEETICTTCGETYCDRCIKKHQKYCY